MVKLIKKLKSSPRFRKTVFPLYGNLMRGYIRSATWWKSSRHHRATLDPFQVIYVDPAEIEYVSTGLKHEWKKGRRSTVPKVKGGDWDLQKKPFKELDSYRSVEMIFRDGKEWNETPLYRRIEKEIESGGDAHGVERKEDIGSVFENLERLYSDIKKNGYRSQEEISNRDFAVHQKPIVDRYMGAINEVNVNIGRDGEILFRDGRHRLSIAKVLDVEKIPVWVFLRHSKWQEKRDRAIGEPEETPENLREHPDIGNQ